MASCLAALQTTTQSSQPLQRSMFTSATILAEFRSRQFASGQYMMHNRQPFLAVHFSSMTCATLYIQVGSFSYAATAGLPTCSSILFFSAHSLAISYARFTVARFLANSISFLANFFLMASSREAVPPDATNFLPNRSCKAPSRASIVTHFVMPDTDPIMDIFVDNSVPATSMASSVPAM